MNIKNLSLEDSVSTLINSPKVTQAQGRYMMASKRHWVAVTDQKAPPGSYEHSPLRKGKWGNGFLCSKIGISKIFLINH